MYKVILFFHNIKKSKILPISLKRKIFDFFLKKVEYAVSCSENLAPVIFSKLVLWFNYLAYSIDLYIVEPILHHPWQILSKYKSTMFYYTFVIGFYNFFDIQRCQLLLNVFCVMIFRSFNVARSCSSPCVFNAGLSTVSPYRRHSCDIIVRGLFKMDWVKRVKMLTVCLGANQDVCNIRVYNMKQKQSWSSVFMFLIISAIHINHFPNYGQS